MVREMRVAAVLLLAGLLSILPRATGNVVRADEKGDPQPPALLEIGPQTLGLSLGYGHGVSAIASEGLENRDVRTLVVALHWQMDFTRRPLEPAWYKGSLAIRAEPTAVFDARPHAGYALGLGLLLRYRLLHWEPVVPYVQVGSGPAYLDLDIADQADGFAFISSAGVGATWQLAPSISVELGARLQHLSNAYTRRPNGGIDTIQILLGGEYRFD